MAFSSSYSSYASPSQNGIWSWKDSYRWVDFDSEASGQVDEELISRWNNTKDIKFSFPLRAGSWFSQSRNKDIYKCYVELNFSRNKISKIYQKNKNTLYQREMRRTPPFKLPERGNKKKLKQLFDKYYADTEEKDIMSENGMLKFFKDVSINPESHDTLIISYLLNCQEMGIISHDEFINGFFYKQGCNSVNDIKKCIFKKCQLINTNNKKWKEFYRWIFKHVKEDEKKKTISTELSIQLWKILFEKDKNGMKLLPKWLEWCDLVKNKHMKVISRDLWELIYDFLKETQNINNYDDAGGSWPIAIDEFVEYLSK